MICYHYIDEKQALQNIQNTIENIEFDFTFWEKHEADIERGAGIVFGALATIFGGAPPAAIAMGKRSGYEAASATEKEIVVRKNRFDNLKKEILSIQFEKIFTKEIINDGDIKR